MKLHYCINEVMQYLYSMNELIVRKKYDKFHHDETCEYHYDTCFKNRKFPSEIKELSKCFVCGVVVVNALNAR